MGLERYCLTALLLLVFLPAQVRAAPDRPHVKVGRVVLNSPVAGIAAPTRIFFRQSYSTPPLVFLLPSNENLDPSTVRVVNVTTASFEVWTTESQGEDGATGVEEVRYLAIEPGNYNLGGGFRVQAGTLATNQFQIGGAGSTGYATATFSPSFGAVPPIVLHEVQTFANDPTYGFNSTALTAPFLETTSLQSSATANSVSITLERAQSSAGTVTANETIAWLAITPGSASFVDGAASSLDLNAFVSLDEVTDACTTVGHGLSGLNVIAIASLGSRDGGDGGWIRQCDQNASTVSLRVQEDRATTPATGHTNERATVVAFERAFDAPGSGAAPRWEAGAASVNSQGVAGGLSFTSVNFPNAFPSQPLVFALPTSEGIAPASTRLRGITPNGFQIAQVAPQGELGAADSMTVDYIAVLPGTHLLAGGTTRLEAGTLETAAHQGANNPPESYATIAFGTPFDAPPALLLDVQTTRSEPGIDPNVPSTPWLEVTVESGSLQAGSVRVALEQAETDAGTVQTETIGYLAAESTIDTSFTSIGGGQVEFQTLITTNNIEGVDNGCFSNSFIGGAFAGGPLAIAQQISRNGANGSWVRRCGLSASQISLQVDEDRAQDSERAHIAETAAVFAFSSAFEWCPATLRIAKTTQVQRDPINGLANPKSIPGAFHQYTIRVENEGGTPIDADTLVILDSIPSETSLFVESSTNFPESPFVFTDGSGAAISGLSFSYLGPSSNADDVAFSDDGGVTFIYQPTPNADGFDDAVTTLRLNPKGILSGSGQASFTIDFGVRIK